MKHYKVNYLKIKDLREARGFSRKDMAKLLCLSELSYRDKEQGHRNFTLEQLLNISLYLGVKLEDLLEQQYIIGGLYYDK